MTDQPALRPGAAVGEALCAVARDILGEARAALDDPARSDAVAVHDYRKAMKRWRALLRLLEPYLGDDGYRLRIEARELARGLAGARDVQAVLDALSDAEKADGLSPTSLATMRARTTAIKLAAETTALTGAMRDRLRAALESAGRAVDFWPLGDLKFTDVAARLADGYRGARRAIPDVWREASDDALHSLRRRVVEHRYQIEVVEPLWPRFGKLWVGEAQRLRERLGSCQDLVQLTTMTAPHQPLAPWRSRLIPLIAARKAVHISAAQRLAGRLFAEKPKAFRRRLKALWESRGEEAP
jgi:CHAD domain-containing protein